MKSDFKRYITAGLLIPVVIYLLYYADNVQFLVISAVIFSLILKEWIYIGNIYYKGFIWVSWVIFLALSHWLLQANDITYLYFICLGWVFLFFLVLVYPKINFCKYSLFRAISLAVIVFGSWLALNQLFQNYSPHHIMFMLLLVWASDTGGYFFGRKYGEIKLSAFVSPNKTIAGLMGSFILGIFLSLIAMPVGLDHLIKNYYIATAIAVVIVIVSVLGDLVESMFKRELGVKESGSLLPGHGGIVDRTDSLIAVIPFYLLLIHLVQLRFPFV